MLSIKLKSKRIENNLSIMDISIRTRLDPSLISRYESGNRLPTREHIIRLANALSFEKEELLLYWLADKIRKTPEEESDILLVQKAMRLLLDHETGDKNLDYTGSKIIQSQEVALKKWKEEISRLAKENPERWNTLLHENSLLLCRDLGALFGHHWSLQSLVEMIEMGRTQPEYDFDSHLWMHSLYRWLKQHAQNEGNLNDEQIRNSLGKLIPEADWSFVYAVPKDGLLALAKIWISHSGDDKKLVWLAFYLLLLNQGYPVLPLPNRIPLPAFDAEQRAWAEYFGEWLVKEMKEVLGYLRR